MGAEFLFILVLGVAILGWSGIQALRRKLYYGGKDYHNAVRQLQLVDRILTDVLHEKKLILREGARKFTDGVAESLAFLKGGRFPPLKVDEPLITRLGKIDELVDAHNAEVAFVRGFADALDGLLAEDRYLTFSDREKLRTAWESEAVSLRGRAHLDLDATESCLARLDGLDGLIDEHNRNFVVREKTRFRSFFNSCLGYPLDDQQRDACVTDEDAVLVIAGAGSGKTSTMAAKVAYLVRKGVAPEDILLLSFTNKAADEMSERVGRILGQPLVASTFHRLGLDLLTKLRPGALITIAEGNKLRDVVHEFFTGQTCGATDDAYSKVVDYFAYHQHGDLPAKGTVPLEEYVKLVKHVTLKTLRGMAVDIGEKVTLRAEKVKSYEEVVIANYLYLNGIEYEYERPYPKEYVGDNVHCRYHPDFYLTDYDIYLEHYGIGRDGEPPPFFTPQEKKDYLDALEWKRILHRAHGNRYVETFSWQVHDGSLFESLERSLKDLGVVYMPVDPKAVAKMIAVKMGNQLSEFERLLSAFITLFKSGGWDESHFRELAAPQDESPGDANRRSSFIAVAETVYELYQDRLKRDGCIDFADMINLAAEKVEQTNGRLPWRYVVVDEYQDTSIGRCRLVRAILKNTGARLFCVGDDWQSIFRFAGSDLHLFTEFGEQFGRHVELKIENTYRNAQDLIDVAGKFVLANPRQKPKSLNSSQRCPDPVVCVRYAGGDPRRTPAEVGEAIVKVLADIRKRSKQAVTSVLLLGRTRYDEQQVKMAIGKNGRPLFSSRGCGVYVAEGYPTFVFRFLTVHKAKGLEADEVIVLNCANDQLGFPNQIADDPILNLVMSTPDDFPYAEERRLFYVAMTRTKHKTYLLVPKECPSPFVEELKGAKSLKIFTTDRCADAGLGKCPRCHSGELVRRSGPKGPFVGCTNYPHCEYVDHGRAPGPNDKVCPKCGHALLLRPSRYGGGSFWGCSSWPNCSYTE